MTEGGLRESNGWFRRLPIYRNGWEHELILETTTPPYLECFALLESLYQSPSRFKLLLEKTYKWTEKQDYSDQTLSCYKSLIQRAKHYYSLALSVNDISAGLLYYYSFVSLTKALLLIRGKEPNAHSSSHGLKTNIRNTGSNSEIWRHEITVSAQNRSLFRSYYDLHNNRAEGIACPLFGRNIDLSVLFGYFYELSFQTISLLPEHTISTSNAMVIIQSGINNTHWIIIAAKNNSRNQFAVNEAQEVLKHSFKRIVNARLSSSDLVSIRERFNIYAEQIKEYVFFEEIEVHSHNERFSSKPINDHLWRIIKNVYSCPLYVNDGDFRFVQTQHGCPFDEPTAIFMLTYYISEIVRYRPETVDYRSPESWLLNEFIRTMPERFLRSIVTDIFQQGMRFRQYL